MRFRARRELSSGGDQRADLLLADHPLNIAGPVHVEDDHGQIVVFAQAHRSCVHDLQPETENFHVGDLVEFHGFFINDGIGVVNAVNLRRF